MMKPIKLGQEIVDLLLPRLKDEFNAFYFYRSASNWCKNKGFFKAGNFFAEESSDESQHAKNIENFLVDWNVTPELPTIEEPQLEFKSLVDIIERAYSIELDLYNEYEATSMKIFKTGDLCVFDFLQQYRAIQTKSVAEYSDKLNMLEGVDTNKMNLLLLEDKLF